MTPGVQHHFSVKLKINPNLYLRDPQETSLGKKIIQHSILMINELGLEQFTFKKLAEKIHSTEASVYRYFENKHLLFIYLLNWYWEWIKVRIDINTLNIIDPSEKLRITVKVLVDSSSRNTDTEFVDEEILHNIVVSEGTKGYHSISIDENNREGFFISYKSLCAKISEIVLTLNPKCKYPRSIACLLVETANNNLYFADHLPRLTDVEPHESKIDKIQIMLEDFAFKLIYD